MIDPLKNDGSSVLPRRIRTYLTVNIVLAVVMALVMVVWAELKTGRFLVIDFLLFCFYFTLLTSLCLGPFGLAQLYLYRKKKGVWYEWGNRSRRGHRTRGWNPEERRYWKNEAILARLRHGNATDDEPLNRTGLFASGTAADSASRPAILMTVAERFERAGKREAAERCYRTIADRFANSPQAVEAVRRLSLVANA